ncbi:dynein regulatory complex protein 11-like [Zerene cesonia]|uniref:dynein regulatory complex protein 11-like n=1 Tax=Zerene cesonia TaxID=33412 RepID=UPI0018E545BB|nr:dynein regulatory complex protein 11-like [Zerene cesonia]
MSSEYYFQQWQKTLRKLEQLLYLDIEYQETKSHDKSSCDAALKLSGMLGCYIACYNEALECSQQNLQVQKSEDIRAIVKTIVGRILELKEQIRKHEGSFYQFIGGGLIKHKLTPYDAELHGIVENCERPENIQLIIDEAFQKARQIKEEEDFTERFDEIIIDETNGAWWNETDIIEETDKKHGINIGAIYEVEEIISEETLHRKHLIAFIQAHEKSRQMIQKLTWQKRKRCLWEKELNGTLNPPARLEIREKAAIIIQKILRTYFQIKRKIIRDYQYDELLGIKIRKKSDENEMKREKQMMIFDRSQKYTELNAQWMVECKEIKNTFLKRKRDDTADDFREYIREWFKKWFDEAKFFLDIPKENQGGLSVILKEEISSPSEWIEEYKAYIEQKKANKNKTATEIKWEKMEAKQEELMLKKEEIRKKKQETELLKKIMKNPKMHPGYHYPKSKKIQRIVKAVEEYKMKWLHIDERKFKEVKEGYIKDIDIDNLYAEAKNEILNTIDEDIREELKKLNQALKEDYARNDEPMPENIKQKIKRPKKQNKIKTVNEEIISEKLTNLVSKGILVEYPKTRFQDFLAEYNFAGDDFKCDLKIVQPLGGEMLSIWWEKCRDVMHGFKSILLIGPRNSGKTILVHVMASINNATLYDLNLLDLHEEPIESIKEIIASLINCAKATQPSVIYIRHVHRLYYRKYC